MAKNKTLWVKAVKGIDHNGKVGEHQVLLFERDPAHPSGEAFIAGPLPVEVGDTTAVVTLLKDGAIEETEAPADAAAPVTAEQLEAQIANLQAQLTAKRADAQVQLQAKADAKKASTTPPPA
jgi:hypothetical protein